MISMALHRPNTGEVVADHRMTDARRDIIARRAREGMQSQQIPPSFQRINETARASRPAM